MEIINSLSVKKEEISFGEIIKKQRKLKKISQLELGKLIGKSQPQINHIETGYAYPLNPECEKLADILELDKYTLLKKLEIDRDISQVKKLFNRLTKNNIDISDIFKSWILL